MTIKSQISSLLLAGAIAVAGLGAASPAYANPAAATQNTGTMVPVLARSIMPGEVIQENDITWLSVPARQVNQTIIGDADGLVGLAARRPVSAHMPVRFSDVQRPILIKRGALVNMTVKSANMTLTTVGRAQDNGSKGDVIRISNASSNKTVTGYVVSARDVIVSDSSPMMAGRSQNAALALR